MDRDKRRSEEDEAALDRKIALIREKNQKIEIRSKEVEQDRQVSGVKTRTRKENNHQEPRQESQKTFSREWDKGKKPLVPNRPPGAVCMKQGAEEWRENVPSLDIEQRLAGRGGGSGRGGRGGRGKVSTGSRLEGRVTMGDRGGSDTQRNRIDSGNGRNSANRRGGRGGQRRVSGGDRNNKDLKITIKDIEEVHAGKRRQAQRNEDGQQQKRSSRPRRANDKYTVRLVMRRVVDDVVKMEKREKRSAQRAEEEEKLKETGEKEADENTIESSKAPEKAETSKDSNDTNDKKTETAENTEKEDSGMKESIPDTVKDADTAKKISEAPKPDATKTSVDVAVEKESKEDAQKIENSSSAKPEDNSKPEDKSDANTEEKVDAGGDTEKTSVTNEEKASANTAEKSENSVAKSDAESAVQNKTSSATVSDANQNVLTLAKEKVLSIF